MSNRTTLMERLNKQLSEMEAVIKRLGPIEGILERMNTLEDSIYTTKNVFNIQGSLCIYRCIRKSALQTYRQQSNPPLQATGKENLFFKERSG